MNKSLKGLLAGCGVLALLGGGLAVLKLTAPETGEESSAAAEETVFPLWSVNSDSISRIDVKQPHGDTYAANRRMEETASKDMEGNPTTENIANYYLEGYEKLPMETVSIRLLATRSPEMTAVQRVEEDPADLAKYGLDEPVEVKFTVDDADPVEFMIGDPTPNSTYTYLQVKGDNAVYTVSTSALDPYLKPMYDYLGLTLKEEQAEDDDTIVKSVRIERSDLDYDFYFEYDPYFAEYTNGGAMALHVMKEPVECLLSADKSSGATHGLYGLTATEIVTPFPKEADLEKAGLGDDPFVRVTMKTDDGKTTVFKMGNSYETADGTKLRYGMLEGVDCIYGFSDENVVYATLKPEDITSKNIIDTYVWDIGDLNCKTADKELKFSGKGESQEDYVLTLNGESYGETDQIERFRQFYSFLLQMKAEDLVMEDVEPTGDVLCEVYVDRQNHLRDYDIKFYDAGNMKAYIEVNGKIRFRCRKSYVDALISNIEIFEDMDKAFAVTW
ncbi:MAG TPA: hypothetical protein DDX71_05955 [Ruminococcus sp.]|nr:hypothetical protein [Ruminococcus sp.]